MGDSALKKSFIAHEMESQFTQKEVLSLSRQMSEVVRIAFPFSKFFPELTPVGGQCS